MKKINFKENPSEVFVTFRWVVDMARNYVPIAVRCKNERDARDVIGDVCSLLGVHYLNMSYSGRLRCDSMIITSDDYLSGKSDFNKTYYEYFNKMFACNQR